MNQKLPREFEKKIRDALASGRMLETGAPESDFLFSEFWPDLEQCLADDLSDPGAHPIRRHVGAVLSLWTANCCDGLFIGVAVNQPWIAQVAADGARSMKQDSLAGVLTSVAACIPPEVLAMEGCEDRLAWYDTETGSPLAERLDELADELEGDDQPDGLIHACVKQVLAEPALFFER